MAAAKVASFTTYMGVNEARSIAARRTKLRLSLDESPLAGGGAPAADAATDFFSSFEASESPPTWESTVETDADGNPRMSALTGSPSPATTSP